jgi:Fe-S cluster assembly protein SufD
VKLDGEGADAVLNGLYLAEGDQLIDNATYIEHAKPHCTSYIGYKGVLADKSRAVFTGKVYVERDAQQTDSNQLNRNLLLSDRATIDTKPQLEIFADDVKCTHGATVGQHPEELIFYFRTRGIDEPMARAMLTFGFADEVVAEVAVEPLRHRLDRYVFHRYSPIEG